MAKVEKEPGVIWYVLYKNWKLISTLWRRRWAD